MGSLSDSAMEVTFPASDEFDQLGRIAAASVAFRLGFKVKTVDKLRAGLVLATRELGSAGTHKLVLDWSKGPLAVTLTNPKAKIPKARTAKITTELEEIVEKPKVKANSIAFAVTA